MLTDAIAVATTSISNLAIRALDYQTYLLQCMSPEKRTALADAQGEAQLEYLKGWQTILNFFKPA